MYSVNIHIDCLLWYARTRFLSNFHTCLVHFFLVNVLLLMILFGFITKCGTLLIKLKIMKNLKHIHTCIDTHKYKIISVIVQVS